MRSAKNAGVIYSGRVGARLRPLTRGMFSSKRVSKKLCRFCGGPLHGFGARLELGGDLCTLPIVCKGMAGRYVRGAWVSEAA